MPTEGLDPPHKSRNLIIQNHHFLVNIRHPQGFPDTSSKQCNKSDNHTYHQKDQLNGEIQTISYTNQTIIHTFCTLFGLGTDIKHIFLDLLTYLW